MRWGFSPNVFMILGVILAAVVVVCFAIEQRDDINDDQKATQQAFALACIALLAVVLTNHEHECADKKLEKDLRAEFEKQFDSLKTENQQLRQRIVHIETYIRDR